MAVARKLEAYLLAVDRGEREFRGFGKSQAPSGLKRR
jgi:hypothetical protein